MNANKYFADQFGDDDLGSAAAAEHATAEELKKQAHVANGGEAQFPCPKCGGTGYWRMNRPCFACKGKGKVGKRVIAAAKGKETREANDYQFAQDHAVELEWLAKQDWSDFYKSLYAQYADRRRLSDGQIAAVQRGMAKAAERAAEKKAAKSGAVDMSAITALFAKAKESELKKPVFRMDGFEVQTDKVNGIATLWVKDTNQGRYVGKVTAGKFEAFRAATAETLPALQAVAADPTAAAMRFAEKFKSCCCCGRTLFNPVSRLAVIGPVCAGNWGLDWMRIQAADRLAEIREEENEQ